MPSPIITLTTGFGLKDPYVAEMKAIILNVCPSSVVIDVTNEVEKINIRAWSFALACAAPYFREGTIHVEVVDPEVGVRRKPIIIQTTCEFFVGPENGLCVLVAER